MLGNWFERTLNKLLGKKTVIHHDDDPPSWQDDDAAYKEVEKFQVNICLTSLTRAKCGTRSTLCWKILNISDSTELFAL